MCAKALQLSIAYPDATYDPRDRILKGPEFAGLSSMSRDDATYDPRDRILKACTWPLSALPLRGCNVRSER